MEDQENLLVNPSTEVLRQQAINNIYAALAETTIQDPHDALAAARALTELEMLSADGWT